MGEMGVGGVGVGGRTVGGTGVAGLGNVGVAMGASVPAGLTVGSGQREATPALVTSQIWIICSVVSDPTGISDVKRQFGTKSQTSVKYEAEYSAVIAGFGSAQNMAPILLISFRYSCALLEMKPSLLASL